MTKHEKRLTDEVNELKERVRQLEIEVTLVRMGALHTYIPYVPVVIPTIWPPEVTFGSSDN